MRITKYIYKEIKKISNDIKKIKTSNSDVLIKSIFIKSNGKPIKSSPLSFGFSKKEKITGEVFFLKELEPSIIFHSQTLKDKILYIENIRNHYYLKFLKNLPVKAVLINKNFYRKIYLESFPIIYTPSILENNQKVEIELDLIDKEVKSQNFFVDVGLGGNFIIILFPFDSRFQSTEDLAFWGSFQLFLTLLRRFKNFQSETLKLRFLAIDFKYSNYIELKKHLEHLDNVIAIYNLDNSGIGNEKLITKVDKYIIDKYHFEKIIATFRKKNEELSYDISKDYIEINLNKPIIWFNSQPNEYLYMLKKEFLNKNLYLNMSEKIFEIITNCYEGVKVDA